MFNKQVDRISNLARTGDLAAARAECEAALLGSPDDPELLNAMGVVSVHASDMQLASEYFAKALALRPDHYGALMNLAEIHLRGRQFREAIEFASRLRDAHKDPASEALIQRIGQAQQAWAQERRLVADARQQKTAASHLELGNFLFAQGRVPEAEAAYETATRQSPKIAEAWFNLGNARYVLKKYAEAAQALQRCIRINPNILVAHAKLSDALHDASDFKGAERAARQALALDARSAHAQNSLGNALLKLEDLSGAEACYRESLAIVPGHPVSETNLAAVLEKKGNVAEAAALLRGIVAREPGFTKAWVGRMRLADTGHSPDEQSIMNEALERFPNDPEVLLAYAIFMENRKYQPEQVLPFLTRAAELSPDYLEVWIALGKQYSALGDVKLATDAARHALRISPESHDSLISWAQVCQLAGDTDEAVRVYRQVLALHPGNYAALAGISGARKFKRDEPEVAQIAQAANQPDLDLKAQVSLFHAMGKVSDDIGEHEQAIAWLRRAKKAKQLNFDIGAHRVFYNRLIADYSSAFFKTAQRNADMDRRPVFIIGMPRSGSSLTEQILASHPQIGGLGEVSTLRGIARGAGFDVETAADAMLGKSSAELGLLADEYREVYKRLDKKFDRYVDKLLHNFEVLWLVALFFPGASIIHCRRNPVDNCLSIFQQNFSEFHAYSQDFETLGLYHREYQRLMAHWNEVLPIKIFDSSYERMVADTEGQARALIAHLGLEWDPACLDFQNTERMVQTASKWQVRQGIYSTSAERWRRYEPWIGDLIDALGGEDEIRKATL